MSGQGRLLERPAGAFPRQSDEAARDRKQPAYSAPASELSGASAAQDWGARQVREWLLLLLRFAVTSDAKDQSAALALADEIDSCGLQWRPSAPSFFRRTTNELCKAITTLDDPKAWQSSNGTSPASTVLR